MKERKAWERTARLPAWLTKGRGDRHRVRQARAQYRTAWRLIARRESPNADLDRRKTARRVAPPIASTLPSVVTAANNTAANNIAASNIAANNHGRRTPAPSRFTVILAPRATSTKRCFGCTSWCAACEQLSRGAPVMRALPRAPTPREGKRGVTPPRGARASPPIVGRAPSRTRPAQNPTRAISINNSMDL